MEKRITALVVAFLLLSNTNAQSLGKVKKMGNWTVASAKADTTWGEFQNDFFDWGFKKFLTVSGDTTITEFYRKDTINGQMVLELTRHHEYWAYNDFIKGRLKGRPIPNTYREWYGPDTLYLNGRKDTSQPQLTSLKDTIPNLKCVDSAIISISYEEKKAGDKVPLLVYKREDFDEDFSPKAGDGTGKQMAEAIFKKCPGVTRVEIRDGHHIYAEGTCFLELDFYKAASLYFIIDITNN